MSLVCFCLLRRLLVKQGVSLSVTNYKIMLIGTHTHTLPTCFDWYMSEKVPYCSLHWLIIMMQFTDILSGQHAFVFVS